MSQDLENLLRDHPDTLRACRLARAELGPDFSLLLIGDTRWELFCHMTVDFSIRPPNPATIMGGPAIRILDEHPLLGPHLQLVPGGDGELFEPPLHLKILILDQSYVIADGFELVRS